MLETLGQAVVDMRGADAADPRLVLEIALVRLTRREAGPPLQTVVERIERLERTHRRAARTAASRRQRRCRRPHRRHPVARSARSAGKRASAPAPDPVPAVEEAIPPAPEPEAPPAEPTPSSPQTALELDDVIVAWAAILPELPVATRSSVQEAQPLKVEGDVITFGVPPRLFEAASPRFRREADAIRAALSDRLGRTARFTLVAHEGFAGNAAPPLLRRTRLRRRPRPTSTSPPTSPTSIRRSWSTPGPTTVARSRCRCWPTTSALPSSRNDPRE